MHPSFSLLYLGLCSQVLSIYLPPVPPSSGDSTVLNCDPDSDLSVEATALLGTSADIDVTDVPFLDLSSVPLIQELPLEAVALETL